MKFKAPILCLFLLVCNASFSQSGKLKVADRDYNSFAYADAIKVYLKVVHQGYATPDLFQKLASAYYFNSDMKNAVKWYDSIAIKKDSMPGNDYFRYAQALKSQERYKEADSAMTVFYERKGDTYRLDLLKKGESYLDRIAKQSGRYEVYELKVNSIYSDFAPSFYKDRLVFASSRDSGVFTRNTHKWNNQPFLELYEAKMTTSGNHSDLKKLKGINSRFHESTSVFSKDGKTVYFTRNNYYEGEYKRDKKGINRLKIFKATLTEFGWGNITEVPFNSDQYSVAHPAFSPDGKKLYFVSDMPGGFGQSDIWMVDISKSGRFGKPKNLGRNVNTALRETFPFVSANGDLYFSSDGHLGLGGLDIFVVPGETENYTAVYNVGAPINSKDDDFSFIVNDKTKLGYYASNREGGVGDDDLYGLRQLKPLVTTCDQLVVGTVRDRETNALLTGAQVFFLDDENNRIADLTSDASGTFELSRDCKKNSLVKISMEGYLPTEAYLPIQTLGGTETLDIALEKEQQPVVVGHDLGKVLKLNPIYFDNNKSNIRPDAAYELSKVVAAMVQYPDLKIEVRAHTDSRGKDKYNLGLSEKRANTIAGFIISNAIDASRVTAKGYGETQPVNECANNVQCSEAKMALNRRSEFIIVSN